MDALQYKYSGPTSVRVPESTRQWIRKRADGMTLAAIIKYGPAWRDRMEELAEELKDTSEGFVERGKLIQKLYAENDELRKFKERRLEEFKKQGGRT